MRDKLNSVPVLYWAGVETEANLDQSVHNNADVEHYPASIISLALILKAQPPACPSPATSDAAVGTSPEITTKGLQEKKEVEGPENRRDAPANGNADEKNREQEADKEEEEEGGEEEEEEEEEEGDSEEEDGDKDEETEALTGKRIAEDNEDDDIDTKKKQQIDEDD
nr:prothymosin alpha-like [Meriones unguiculatus]